MPFARHGAPKMLRARRAAHSAVDADPKARFVRKAPICPGGIARAGLILFYRNRRHRNPGDPSHIAARVDEFNPNMFRCEQGRLIPSTNEAGYLRAARARMNHGFV